MKKNQLFFPIALILIALSWFSCTDDYFEFDKIKSDNWRPELAFPLVNSTLTLEDIIIKNDSNETIQEDPNTGILEIIYEGRVFSANGALAVNIPTQSIQEGFELPASIPSNNSGGTLTQTFKTDFEFDNQGSDLEIDSLFLKQGVLAMQIENDFEHNVEVEITFPTFRNASGNPLTLLYNLPAAPNSSSFSMRSSSQSLTNYTLNMTEDRNGSPDINTFPAEVKVTFNLTPNVGSNSNDQIRINGNINNLDFKNFWGYIGKTNLNLDEDTIKINLFRNFRNGTFFLSNPLLDINVTNSFGTPIEFNFQRLFARNVDKNPNRIGINIPTNPISLNYPTTFGSEVTSSQLDNANSNIDSVVSFLVKEIIYKSEAELNPNGKTTTRNFLTDTSKIGLDVYLRLPFEGRASGFRLIDTLDFNFENSENIEEGLVRVKMENGFPIDAEVQVIFLDENFLPIDSLYADGQEELVVSSITDINGKTIQNSKKITDVTISRERLEKLSDGKFAIVRAVLQSEDALQQNNVKFFDNYRLSINLGIKAKILIDIN